MVSPHPELIVGKICDHFVISLEVRRSLVGRYSSERAKGHFRAGVGYVDRWQSHHQCHMQQQFLVDEWDV